MKVNMCLWNDSFNYRANIEDESAVNCIIRLEQVQEIIRSNGQVLQKATSIYEEEIERDILLGDWIYGVAEENRDERMLLGILLDQSETIEETEYAQLVSRVEQCNVDGTCALVGFYKTVLPHNQPLYIYDEQDCMNTHRFYLHHCREKEGFIAGMQKAFSNLYFSEQVRRSISDFRPFHDFVDEIIMHLSVLNDMALSLFAAHGSEGEDAVLRRLGSAGSFACFIQGDPRYEQQHLCFAFMNDDGIEEQVICSPHTKLFHAGSNYRIYFHWGKPTIQNGEKLLIGHIGRHL